jgi:hypothetical protein
MFAYCTNVLHLSEFEAYLRITAARAARQHPVLLAMLREGSLHLTAVAKLAPHLTRENCETHLGRATHRTKREIEELIAEVAPRPDTPTVVRKLPDCAAAAAPVQALPQDLDRGSVLGTQLVLDRVELPGLKQTLEAASAGWRPEGSLADSDTTATWPRSTTAGSPWPSTGAPRTESPIRRIPGQSGAGSG